MKRNILILGLTAMLAVSLLTMRTAKASQPPAPRQVAIIIGQELYGRGVGVYLCSSSEPIQCDYNNLARTVANYLDAGYAIQNVTGISYTLVK